MKITATRVTRALTRAFSKGVHTLEADPECTAIATHAAFILSPKGEPGTRDGLQVFVCLARYSEKLLRRRPSTGGLHCADGAKIQIPLKRKAKARPKAVKYRSPKSRAMILR